MTTEITSKELVHRIPGAADIAAEHHEYPTAHGPLPFDLYRPPGAALPCPAVVLVSGYPDPALAAMVGAPIRRWASYVGWARLLAASGVAGIAYENREPADAHLLVEHLRSAAGLLGIDPARLGVWACSGNAPTALELVARQRPACAALLYGYLLDLDGATEVAEAARAFHFAVPPVALDELPRETSLLLVRAGADATPGLDPALLRFHAAARARGLPVTLIDHPEAPHAFDLVDDSPPTHAVIEEVLGFLRTALT